MTNWEKALEVIEWRHVTPIVLPDNLFKWLKDKCWEQRNKKLEKDKMNKNLVGHIKEEYRIPVHPTDFERFIVSASAEGPSNEWYKKYAFNTEDRPIVFENLWCNFQKKYEFNPPHTHSGVMSFVIFVNIPYNLDDEDKVYPDVKVDGKTQHCTSRFMFINTRLNGEIVTDALNVDKSFEGKGFIFPNSQMHQVFPFYTSDDYRITVSGNLRYKV